MTKEECIALMKSSRDDNEWNHNCAKVKAAHGGGYPNYWYSTFIASGMINEILSDPTANKLKLTTGAEAIDILRGLK
jgi:hypothetical protein